MERAKPTEEEFISEVYGAGFGMRSVDIRSIDEFLVGRQRTKAGKHLPLPTHIRTELEAERAEALAAYVAGDFTLALWRAIALRRACESYGMQLLRRGASRSGGDATAEILKSAAVERDRELVGEANKLRVANPGLSRGDVSRILEQRGYGGAESIRKKLSRLLPK